MAAGEILNLLARVNLAAAAAIVLVVALRKIARPRFGARLVYSLWLLPMLAAAAVVAPARVVTVAARIAAQPASAAVDVFEGVAPVGLPATLPEAALDPRMLILALWLAGVAGAALVMTLLQRRFTAEVRKGAIGPAVVGVIAPRIVTPSDFEQKFSREEQALVLAHERAHIDRQDSRLNGLSAAIQCLCWFNPLIHLAAHLMRIDQEMACDETVVTRFPKARRAYAQALVKAQLAIRPLPLGCYWPSGTEHPLLERIAMLKLNDFSRRRRLAGGSALAMLCAATGFAAWASQPPQVRIAPAAAAAAATPVAATPATAPVPAAQTAEAQIARPEAVAPDADAAEIARLGRLVSAATPPPPPKARVTLVAALDPPPGFAQPVPPRPVSGAPGSPPSLTDSQRQTSRDYMQCQREAVRALDDGHSSEDAIATLAEPRCEAQYQAYRKAWSEGAGPGAPDERAWSLDNGRQERARGWVHASRQAMVRISDIKTCVGRVADQFGSEPFDRIVDQGVLRCGALIPFPVTPRGLETAMTEQQLQDRKDRQDRATRTMIATDLRQVIGAKPSAPQ
jgi:beta-lactamase regulating signal transducer with metallopeptidase domain